jgi:hypothetical protein
MYSSMYERNFQAVGQHCTRKRTVFLSFEVKYMFLENVGVLDFNRRYENFVSPLVFK